MHPAAILRARGLNALKNLGQNFLSEPAVFARFWNELPAGRIAEIGPGLGTLTCSLLAAGFSVIAIEKDRGLAAYLREELGFCDYPDPPTAGSWLIEGDFLETPADLLQQCGVNGMVSNLPFYVATPILLRVLTEMPFVTTAIWGLQKEMARRAAAPAGNSLAILLQLTGSVRYLGDIPAGAFYPRPEVDGGVVLWKRGTQNPRPVESMTRTLFWGKRKTIRNCLRRSPHAGEGVAGITDIPECSHLMDRRADEVSLDDFRLLLQFWPCNPVDGTSDHIK